MDWPSDTLTGVLLFCFAFGLLFSIISLMLGAGGDSLALPASDLDLPGGDTAAQDGSAARIGNPSPVNISTVMIFLTWFGAAGYLLRVFYGAAPAVSLLGGGLAGLVGATLIYLFLARVLWRGQSQLDPADYAVAGTPGRVSSPIRAGGTGEIVYVLDQKQQVAGARSLDGAALPLGAEVEVVRYEGGLAYVRPRASTLDEGPFGGQPFEPAPAESRAGEVRGNLPPPA